MKIFKTIAILLIASPIMAMEFTPSPNTVSGDLTITGDVTAVDGTFTGLVTADSMTVTNQAIFTNGNVGIGTTAPLSMLHLESATSSKPTIRLDNTNDDANSGILRFYKNGTSSADSDRMIDIRGYGEDSATALALPVQILGKFSDITSGDTAGMFEFFCNVDASAKSLLTLNGYNGSVGEANVIVNDNSVDCDFIVESDNDLGAFYVQGSDGNVGIGTTTPAELLHLESSNTNEPTVLIKNTNDDAKGGTLDFEKDGTSPLDDDKIAEIKYYGDDSGGNRALYGYSQFRSEDVTDGDEAGSIEWFTSIDGASQSMLYINGFNGSVGEGYMKFNDSNKDMDFVYETLGSTFTILGSDGNVGIGTTSPVSTQHTVGTVQVSSATDSSRNMRFIGNFDALPTSTYLAGDICTIGATYVMWIATEAVASADSWIQPKDQ